MDGPRNYHTKWSNSDRERQIPYEITYICNLKNDTSELIYKIEMDSQMKKTPVVNKKESEKGKDKLGIWD